MGYTFSSHARPRGRMRRVRRMSAGEKGAHRGGRRFLGTLSGWWFGTCFIFPYIGKHHPNWLIFFRGIETTNQQMSIDFLFVIRKWYEVTMIYYDIILAKDLFRKVCSEHCRWIRSLCLIAKRRHDVHGESVKVRSWSNQARYLKVVFQNLSVSPNPLELR